MAITDNIFTGPELIAALQANPTLSDIVAGVATDNAAIRGIIEPKIVGPVTKKHAEDIEKDVFDMTGIAKNGEEKYFEYLKRAFGKVKEDLTSEITTLKGKHTPTEADKARIEQLQAQLVEKDKAHTQALTAEKQKTNDAIITSAINAALPDLKFKADLPESVVKIMKDNAIADLRKTAKVEADGTVTYYDDKGELIQNKDTYKPAGAGELLKGKLTDVIDAGTQQPGAGSKPEVLTPPTIGAQPPKGTAPKYAGIPPTVKSRLQLTEHLNEIGILEGSEDWNKAYTDADTAQLPLR